MKIHKTNNNTCLVNSVLVYKMDLCAGPVIIQKTLSVEWPLCQPTSTFKQQVHTSLPIDWVGGDLMARGSYTPLPFIYWGLILSVMVYNGEMVREGV